MRVRLKQPHLLDLIARSNLSQNHWAIKLGLSRGHWSDVVNGKHPYPSARTRTRLMEVFGASFDELFEVDSGPAPGSETDFKSAIADRYLIDRQVGQGGMGTVYLARDVKLGRQVAIKVVSPEAVSGIGVQQFLKEIRYTARLQHPHIVPLFDAGEAAGYPFYVTPFVRDGSLRDLLKRRGRFAVPEAIAIIRGIAAALHHAHEQRVLHCDVKPENILLDGRHAYVADFGISRAVHAEALEWGKRQEIDSSAGTPAYVSPEQASGEEHLDPRSDVYSFACMVFEMLSGRPPFTGTKTMEIVAQRFTSHVPDLRTLVPHVPEGLCAAVSRGMALSSERRFASVEDFGNALVGTATERDPGSASPLALRLSRIAGGFRRLIGRSPSGRVTNRKGRLMLDTLRQDLTYAFRTLRRAPGFSGLVVVTLAFGIAANTVVFSFINPYFFRPLPFGDADRLVQVGQVNPVAGWDGGRFSVPMYRDYLEGNQSFQDLAFYRYHYKNMTGEGDPQRIYSGVLTANMFSVLQAQPELGRTFVTGEDGPSGADVVVLAHGLWQRAFGGEASVVGQTVFLDDVAHTVVGVMPAEFNFPFGEIELWVPHHDDATTVSRTSTSNIIVGRLQDGVTAERARDELTVMQTRFAEQYPDADGFFDGISIKPMREALNFAWDVLRIMSLLMLIAVGFALLVACINVASLSLARATSRTGEVALRSALGAGKSRIVRQFLTESVVLAVAGGGVGVALAFVITSGLGGILPDGLYKVGDPTIDGRVLAFTLLVTLLTPVFFGLAPALGASRADLNSALKDGGRSGWGLRSMRARQGLVVFEIAMAVVMVAGMGLMVRSFVAVQNVHLGFEEERLVIAEVSPPRAAYGSIDQLDDYYRQVKAAIEALPGVRGTGATAVLPLNHEDWGAQFARPGREPAAAEDWPRALQYQVSPDYFDAMRIPVLGGRPFDARDNRDAPPAVIVSRVLVDAHWPGENPVGQSIMFGDPDDPTRGTIVGVAGDVKHEGIVVPERAAIYRAIDQVLARRRFVVVSGSAEPSVLIPAIRRAMYAVDPNLPVSLRPMTAIVAESTLQWSVTSIALSVLGLAALGLASLGIYGVISYSVAQRRREIGVRMALGATGRRIRGVFVGEGIRLGLIGIGLGVVLALGVGRLMSAMLFGVSPFDPVTNGAAVVLFTAVAVLASFVPALRASRVDPQGALRAE